MQQQTTPAATCHAGGIASRVRGSREALGLITAMLLTMTSAAAAADIRVENAWSRATPPGIDRGAGYMTLHNTGSEARTLTGARADGAQRIAIHESREVNGQMRMDALPDGLTLDPGERVELAPMGIHLMIMGLDEPLVRGDTFPLTLVFRNGDTLETELAIRAPDSSAHPHSH